MKIRITREVAGLFNGLPLPPVGTVAEFGDHAAVVLLNKRIAEPVVDDESKPDETRDENPDETPDETPDDETETEPTPVKRGPGRPRKNG